MFNKDIDRLFQEQFKDFEQSPHPKIWKGIEKELKTTPSVFYRFRWLGFAGSLLLVFGLWQIFTTPTSKTVKSNFDTKEILQPNKNKGYKTQNNNNNSLVVDDNSVENNSISKLDDNIIIHTKTDLKQQTSKLKNTHLKNVSSPKNNTSVLKTISLKKNKTQIITAPNKKNYTKLLVHKQLSL